jgi:hypothetical protein
MLNKCKKSYAIQDTLASSANIGERKLAAEKIAWMVNWVPRQNGRFCIDKPSNGSRSTRIHKIVGNGLRSICECGVDVIDDFLQHNSAFSWEET